MIVYLSPPPSKKKKMNTSDSNINKKKNLYQKLKLYVFLLLVLIPTHVEKKKRLFIKHGYQPFLLVSTKSSFFRTNKKKKHTISEDKIITT